MELTVTESEKNKEEEIQAWLDQVHYGSCCSDEPDTCERESEDRVEELEEEEPPSS